MTESIASTYDPKIVESRWYDVWDKAGYFQPAKEGKPYVIVIPPPNVTGSLHMGHALNSTIQDILIRYRRMRGFAALWVPGTDHGGIATQNVVEKLLMKENKTRHDLGREKFMERMWAWRKEAGDNILNQSKRLGASMDLSRSRFTMDEQCSRAVRKAFVELYHRKLLYRGKRLVNWCPRCSTALADIEVEHNETQGSLWHIRYPLAEKLAEIRTTSKKGKANPVLEQGYIIVATTRPETLLGDTAVAVHPKDKRYKELIGSMIRLPISGRTIPVIADDVVDQSFGSGAVKVTPAHDPTDFEIAERSKLSHVTVIGFDGRMTETAGAEYAGLDRFEARKKVVEELEKTGALDKVEDYRLSVSVCYRCDSVVEPLESEQWFLSMSAMAKKAREANKKGKVKIVPESWESPYQLWLRNLKDWCVSRQIWWGHRIPVWTCENKKCEPIVSMEDPTRCPTCQGSSLEQDPDVLDTWFSSALWPFSVFGWPDETPDLKRFFPTQTLVTGHEILYLWVARMVMFGLEFLEKSPFQHVLIHGIVRDKKGRKMSKSLGNVIDPLELIEEFGADAVRFSLAQSAAPGRDMQISKENFVSARNFSNKIWNATRFVLMRLGGMGSISPVLPKTPGLELPDRWILHRFNQMVRETTESIEHFDLDAASRGLYDFFWGDYCSWYLEMVKPRVDRENFSDYPCTAESTQAAKNVLAMVLEGTLKLLHPFIPFLTEELWEKIPKTENSKNKHMMMSQWPEVIEGFDDSPSAASLTTLQEIITKLRTIRSEMGIPPTQSIEVLIKEGTQETADLIRKNEVILKCLNSRVGKISISKDMVRPKASAVAVVPGANLFVPLEGLIDFSKERTRLEKELLKLRQDAEKLSKKMSNQDFISHAPQEEVEKAKGRLDETHDRIKHLEGNIATLS
ncbi:MAG: Valine--tRNA ligase [Elusimicrobia bacterium]|nr:Valine--tRNA ligase [Elusimicrobiota bacterium]